MFYSFLLRKNGAKASHTYKLKKTADNFIYNFAKCVLYEAAFVTVFFSCLKAALFYLTAFSFPKAIVCNDYF